MMKLYIQWHVAVTVWIKHTEIWNKESRTTLQHLKATTKTTFEVAVETGSLEASYGG